MTLVSLARFLALSLVSLASSKIVYLSFLKFPARRRASTTSSSVAEISFAVVGAPISPKGEELHHPGLCWRGFLPKKWPPNFPEVPPYCLNNHFNGALHHYRA